MTEIYKSDFDALPAEDKTDLLTKPGLYAKMNKLRALVIQQNWEDDKIFKGGAGFTGGYGYISADKVKKNLAPLFAECGLELRMNFSDLQSFEAIGNMKQHWVLKLTARIIDTETGAYDESVVYGEAGDSGDKGINKAQTCAVKQWAFHNFLIADGIDPDAFNVIQPTEVKFNKTPEEREEVLSKARAHAMEPPAPEPKVKMEKAVPATMELKKDAKVGAVPVKEDAPKFELAGPQKNAINKILERVKKENEEGQWGPEEYDEFDSMYHEISSSKDAAAFIRKYRNAAR